MYQVVIWLLLCFSRYTGCSLKHYLRALARCTFVNENDGASVLGGTEMCMEWAARCISSELSLCPKQCFRSQRQGELVFGGVIKGLTPELMELTRAAGATLLICLYCHLVVTGVEPLTAFPLCLHPAGAGSAVGGLGEKFVFWKPAYFILTSSHSLFWYHANPLHMSIPLPAGILFITVLGVMRPCVKSSKGSSWTGRGGNTLFHMIDSVMSQVLPALPSPSAALPSLSLRDWACCCQLSLRPRVPCGTEEGHGAMRKGQGRQGIV